MSTLYVVSTPIGTLEDISYRAVRTLGEVDLIAAEDTRAARVLLDRYGVRGGRLVSFFEGNEARRTEDLVAELLAGVRVALISEAGTPGISDPGQRLVNFDRIDVGSPEAERWERCHFWQGPNGPAFVCLERWGTIVPHSGLLARWRPSVTIDR